MPQYVDPDDYEGQLYCRACQLLSDVELVQSRVKRYRVAERQTRPRAAAINVMSAVPRPHSEEPGGGVADKGES